MRKNIFRKVIQSKRKEQRAKDNRLRLLVSSLTYPLPNGVTASINTAVDGLLKNDYYIKIVAPDYKTGTVRPEHETVPSSLIAHAAVKKLFGKEERVFRPTSSKKISAIENDFDPDIYWLHTVTFAPNVFERHMLKSKKGKVLFYHTLVEEYGRLYAGKIGAAVMRKRTKELCNKVDAVMTPSMMMKERLLECGVKTPVSIIPTGIDAPPKSFTKKEIRSRFNIPEKAKILLYLGRMSKEKNLEPLLHMMVELKKRNYNAVLLFVGPGDIAEVNEEAKEMKIDDVVICSGPLKREDAQMVYGACDAFVFTSQTETQGLVIGEAMLADLPVVALTSPIQKEVYPRGKAVVITKEDKLADAVVNILDNKKEREKMVKDAKEFVLKKFSREEMTRKQMKVFEEVYKKIK